MTTKQRSLIALDFDGVICDSVRETCASGWRAARNIWPDDFVAVEPPPDVLQRFIRLRPYLHTGYEAIPLLRMAYDGVEPAGYSAGEIEDMKRQIVSDSPVSREEFLRLFSQARDQWIAEDEDGWLSRNRFYDGTLTALKRLQNQHEVFIVTTKQTRFAEKLLQRAGANMSRQRIFGLDTGKSKETIIQELRGRPELRGRATHFVEDRLPTLRRIEQVPELADVSLYLCDWGYNTPEDRAEVKQDPRINLLHSLDELAACRA